MGKVDLFINIFIQRHPSDHVPGKVFESKGFNGFTDGHGNVPDHLHHFPVTIHPYGILTRMQGSVDW